MKLRVHHKYWILICSRVESEIICVRGLEQMQPAINQLTQPTSCRYTKAFEWFSMARTDIFLHPCFETPWRSVVKSLNDHYFETAGSVDVYSQNAYVWKVGSSYFMQSLLLLAWSMREMQLQYMFCIERIAKAEFHFTDLHGWYPFSVTVCSVPVYWHAIKWDWSVYTAVCKGSSRLKLKAKCAYLRSRLS